ncbi:MAG: hypothetical protein KC643_15495 [Nitrospira sp.]|nr:hypothetical protein [Nitrospira sp.]
MKIIIIPIFAFALFFSSPVFSQTPSGISQEAKDKVLPLINEVIPPIFRTHQQRILTVAFLEVCNEEEKLLKIYDQKIIEDDIYERVQNSAQKFSIPADEIPSYAMMSITYVEGFRTGYGAAVKRTISSDDELKNFVTMLRKQL